MKSHCTLSPIPLPRPISGANWLVAQAAFPISRLTAYLTYHLVGFLGDTAKVLLEPIHASFM